MKFTKLFLTTILAFSMLCIGGCDMEEEMEMSTNNEGKNVILVVNNTDDIIEIGIENTLQEFEEKAIVDSKKNKKIFVDFDYNYITATSKSYYCRGNCFSIPQICDKKNATLYVNYHERDKQMFTLNLEM